MPRFAEIPARHVVVQHPDKEDVSVPAYLLCDSPKCTRAVSALAGTPPYNLNRDDPRLQNRDLLFDLEISARAQVGLYDATNEEVWSVGNCPEFISVGSCAIFGFYSSELSGQSMEGLRIPISNQLYGGKHIRLHTVPLAVR